MNETGSRHAREDNIHNLGTLGIRKLTHILITQYSSQTEFNTSIFPAQVLFRLPKKTEVTQLLATSPLRYMRSEPQDSVSV